MFMCVCHREIERWREIEENRGRYKKRKREAGSTERGDREVERQRDRKGDTVETGVKRDMSMGQYGIWLPRKGTSRDRTLSPHRGRWVFANSHWGP